MDIVPTEPVVDSSAITTEQTSADDTGSLADHEAQFRPNAPRAKDTIAEPETEQEREDREERERDDKGRFAKHRAQSQKAAADDVPAINQLTKELRDLERELGEKDPDATASPRIRGLKRQIAALRALKAPAATEPVAAPKAESFVVGEFTEKEPVFEDFQADPEKYPDPLAAWMRATARYEARKDRWEERQAESSQRLESEQGQLVATYQERQAKFAAEHPDFANVVAPLWERNIGPILVNAIVRDDNGPAVVYHLAQRPELVDELVLLTHGKPFSEELVAVVQRRLKSSVLTAQSPDRSPQTPPYIPPRPPNPVRTGPIRTGNEPPGDESSLVEHEKAYYRPRR